MYGHRSSYICGLCSKLTSIGPYDSECQVLLLLFFCTHEHSNHSKSILIGWIFTTETTNGSRGFGASIKTMRPSCKLSFPFLVPPPPIPENLKLRLLRLILNIHGWNICLNLRMTSHLKVFSNKQRICKHAVTKLMADSHVCIIHVNC